jgi:hypothetical protein
MSIVHMLARPGDIDLNPAEAPGPAGRALRRHPTAAVEHLIFPSGPGALTSEFGKIGIGDNGFDPFPCCGEL